MRLIKIIKLQIKSIVRHIPVYDFWLRLYRKKILSVWEKSNKLGSPPHLIKQMVIKEYARRFNINTLIETGTYLGDMINSVKDIFKEIYSIELDSDLFRVAQRRFRKYPHIHIIYGDSSKMLSEVLKLISTRCLFWLDAHYSGGFTAKGKKDTLIEEELDCILSNWVNGWVILIDDARLFVGQNGYPNLRELQLFILSRLSKYSPTINFDIKDDIIRIYTTQ